MNGPDTGECAPLKMGRIRFIVFEGIDGSGKSTQAKLLARRLEDEGISVLLTAEPSDGPVGQLMRSLKIRPDPEEEERLFTEDRRDHVERVILPALRQGRTVICDRYIHSSAAYQGSRGLDPGEIVSRNLLFAPLPNVVFLLEIPVDVAVSRIRAGRPDGFTTFEALENLRAVDAVYRIMDDPLIRRLDGCPDPDEVHSQVMSILAEMSSSSFNECPEVSG